MTPAALALLAAVTAHPVPAARAEFERPPELCAVAPVASALDGTSGWRDLAARTMENPILAAELDAILPGYRLAFVHEPTLGLLLVAGEREEDQTGNSSPSAWRQAAEETRRSCAAEALSCEIAPLGDDESVSRGLAVSSRLEQAGEVYRRETLAFLGPDSCGYRLQFTGPESALGRAGWSEVRGLLKRLHRLVLQRAGAG